MVTKFIVVWLMFNRWNLNVVDIFSREKFILHSNTHYSLLPTCTNLVGISPSNFLLGALNASIGALGLQEVETPRVSRQSAHGGGNLFSPKPTGRFYLSGVTPCTNFF